MQALSSATMAGVVHCNLAAAPGVSRTRPVANSAAPRNLAHGCQRSGCSVRALASHRSSAFFGSEELVLQQKCSLTKPTGKDARRHLVVRNAVHDTSNDGSVPPWKTGKSGKRTDIKKIMILGAGPIVIGQACEFDYSGTQACKALREEGYEVVLLNSNPATIMTDPDMAPRTYVTPMTPTLVEDIIAKERPDALLPTMGGQTALNLAKALAESGVLDKYGVELIGAKLDAINKAEDRELFKQAMNRIGVKSADSRVASTVEEALEVASWIGSYPIIVRPAFTLGGTGGGIAYNQEELVSICKGGLAESLTKQVLIEKSLLGWKEFELEVMRDLADNVVIICSIENVDPMGVHTGDSVTVAPAQTLTDKEYQRLRDQAVAIIREIGVECGGSNVQFAINPVDGEVIVIEMNPRVSRSSALASKATGFPIAKMAAKLSVGYTLDQIANDITLKTPASFEPSIDYVVTKIPRFAFEKFPGSSPVLGTQMKSVGEAMAMGRTFQESFQKCMRSLETGLPGFGGFKGGKDFYAEAEDDVINYNLRTPTPERYVYIHSAFKRGYSEEKIVELTKMDPWWINQMAAIYKIEQWLQTIGAPENLTALDLRELKRHGFSDVQIANLTGSTALNIRALRKKHNVVPAYKRVDTCAAEFEAFTPYLYSSYDEECEAAPTKNKKVLILGGGPNRIGQGIEFDYCCCHACFALSAEGYETIMMNSNPETVSTDYDTSDRLYFEPLTIEDVLNVIEMERPDGIIVQFGGQTPLKLAIPIDNYLKEHKIPAASGQGLVRIWGTQPQDIDAAEDRDIFMAMLNQLNIKQAPGGIATSEGEALDIARRIGYPVMVRPSYVLGGRAMEIVYNDEMVKRYLKFAVAVDPEKPVLIDKFLDSAVEIDIDCLADQYGNVAIGGIMEHIEQAGIHSGDSACSIPTQTIAPEALAKLREWTIQLALKLKVVGLMNLQFAVRGKDDVYIIEANPRASRTVPFVSKAIGHPLAKYASLAMAGKSLKEVGYEKEVIPKHVAIKEAVLPFDKFPGADTLLGPEMRSTGEVMGIDTSFAMAFAKAQIEANQRLPLQGTVFISMKDELKGSVVAVAKGFMDMGFKILATGGTAKALAMGGVPSQTVLKLHEGRPNVMDAIVNGEVQLMLITSSGDENDQRDGRALRRQALAYKIPQVSTISGGMATLKAIKAMRESPVKMLALQDFVSQ
eukprot:jgi/Mesvir1/3190/Mv16345-RA.1